MLEQIRYQLIKLLQGTGEVQFKCSCGKSWIALSIPFGESGSIAFSCDKCIQETYIHRTPGVKV